MILQIQFIGLHSRRPMNIHSSFILLCLQQVYSLFEREFSSRCDLVLPISAFSPPPSSSCLRLLLQLSVTSILLSIFPSITCFRRQFRRTMGPIQLAFVLFTVCRIFLSSLTLCNNSSFLTRFVQLIFFVLQKHNNSKLSRYF